MNECRWYEFSKKFSARASRPPGWRLRFESRFLPAAILLSSSACLRSPAEPRSFARKFLTKRLELIKPFKEYLNSALLGDFLFSCLDPLASRATGSCFGLDCLPPFDARAVCPPPLAACGLRGSALRRFCGCFCLSRLCRWCLATVS